MHRIQRQYSESEKGTALAVLTANGGNLLKTSRDLGIPRQTVQSWRQGVGITPAIAENSAHKKALLADKFEEFVRVCLDACMDPDRIAQASYFDLMRAMGIAVDKMVLLRRCNL